MIRGRSARAIGACYRIENIRRRRADSIRCDAENHRGLNPMTAPHAGGPTVAVVVNDDATQRNVLSGLLRTQGFEVLSFEDAEAALSAMIQREAPHLVVTDLYMPGIDGWRFCRLLRSPEYEPFNCVPILVVSATFSGDEAARITRDTGADAFMPAPVDGQRFLEQVRSLLGGARRQQRLRALIVEDSNALAVLLQRAFEAHGYRADTAPTLQQAVSLLEETAFDTAVIDYHLPDGAGDSLLETVRALRPDCVCIMMTGDPAPVPALDWMKQGASAFLRKPFEPAYLIEMCARARRERALLRVEDLLEERTHELKHRLEFEKLLTSLSAELMGLPTEETSDGIDRVLKKIGEFSSVDRAYVFLFRDGDTWMDNTHEWCAPDVEPQKERLQRLPTNSFSWWMERLRKREPIHIPRLAMLPPGARSEHEFLKSQGIRSVLVVPLPGKKSLVGFLGFDSVRAEKTWSEGDIALLRAAGEFITHTLLRRQAEEALRESENRIRKKLDALLDPPGDIGRLELVDIIDSKAIQSMMDDFYQLTRLPMSIIDLRGRVLVGIGWQEICLKFHRKHPETLRRCLESDLELTREVPPGEVTLYKCRNHMWDMATPIFVGETKVGNLFMGQFFFDDEPLDRLRFLEQARRFGFDEERYLAALGRVPRLNRATVVTAMRFFTKLARMLSLLSLGNLKLARTIAEKDRALEALREREELLAKSQEIAHLGSWELDLLSDRLIWSDEVYRIFGLEPQEFGPTYEAFLEAVHPDDRAAVDAAYSESLREGREGYEMEHRVVKRTTGEIREVHERCVHIRDESGAVIRSVGMVQDITEHKRAEEERERLREQLTQARKMESVGRLAGGVAHDFNNMLQAILGHVELALDRVDSTHPLHADLQEIRKAAQRSAELTGQLLAFARRQTIRPRVLNLNEAVSGTLRMLRRLIGENIELIFKPGSDLWPIQADPAQIDQVLANLSVNARDAIHGTGHVTIETENVFLDNPAGNDREEFVPGEYVLLAVSDTGAGMHPKTLEHMFEPFFTTKETGKGTGLGLATVYGIVKQNGGLIHVDSEPAQGTTVRMYLPRAHTEASANHVVPEKELPRGAETVLLVEDEESILNLGKSILERLGYSVLTAHGPFEALTLVESHTGPIHLLITDVIMPRMNGKELAEHVATLRPEIRRLYMSGYTANAIAHHGVLEEGVRFLQKPFTLRTLAEAVREILDG